MEEGGQCFLEAWNYNVIAEVSQHSVSLIAGSKTNGNLQQYSQALGILSTLYLNSDSAYKLLVPLNIITSFLALLHISRIK